MAGLFDKVANAVSGNILDHDVKKAAEASIKENSGMDITLDTDDIPSDWEEWIKVTGVNSIANSDTWRFTESNEWNSRKAELWKERKIDKIVLTVKTEADSDDYWITSMVEWETGSSTFKVVFYPRARNWSSSNKWTDSGYKTWWNLSDEIVFGLQLYQLPGKCFYKSDWLDDFEDVDPDGFLPTATKKTKRWFQFRHWIIYWYPTAMWGWNWAYTKQPPKMPDGSDFNLNAVLSVPSLPDFKMPAVKLPSLPDIELPSMPDVSLPDVSLPDVSISAPSLSIPSFDPSAPSLPSMPEKPKRPAGKWACHGFIELTDLKVKASGKDVILSNATLTNFWEKNGHIDTEKKEHQRLVLKSTSDEQATSWKESLMESGVEEGDMGGCCTVA